MKTTSLEEQQLTALSWALDKVFSLERTRNRRLDTIDIEAESAENHREMLMDARPPRRVGSLEETSGAQ